MVVETRLPDAFSVLIGAKTLETVALIAAEQECSQFSVLERADSFVALKNSAATLLNFAQIINDLTRLAESTPLDALFDIMLEKTGYRQMLVAAGPEEAERLENLDEFKSGILEYLQDNDEPSLTGFLEETALVADVDRYDETADAVVMMTVHSAKGLEFPVVFLPGMEEGLFPGMQTITEGQSEMEEERRLAYVAITRAKKELCILHTRNRLLYGQTMYNPVSRFVSEIPESLIEKLDEGQANAVRVGQNRYGEYTYGQHGAYGAYGNNYNAPVPQKRTYYTENATRTQQTSSLGKPATPARPAASTSREVFAPGDRVKHLNFGEGEILSVKSMGADTLYEVMFDTVGTKKLMATYAKLKKL